MAAEHAIWAVIVGIALGQESSHLLQWFVQNSDFQFENLEVNAENTGKYFINGLIKGSALDVDGSEDAEMSDEEITEHMRSTMPHNESGEDVAMANDISSPSQPSFDIPNALADVPMQDGETLHGGSPPPTRPSSPLHANPLPDSTIPRFGSLPPIDTSNADQNRARSPASSLSSLTGTEDDAAGTKGSPRPAPAEVRTSTREVKIPARFMSGVTLTQTSAPASKKRKRDTQGPTPAPITGKVKEEDLYWATAFAHVSAVVSMLQHHCSFIFRS